MNTETQTNNQKTSPRDLEKGALWLKKSKAGADFLSGYIVDESNNKVNVVVFKNGYKKPGESSPDYRLYLSENQNQASPSSNNQQKKPSSKLEQEEASNSADNSDDIPF
jgi:hypothetical protein